ncbi:cytochrome b [Pelagibius litoralis]|uniref:Cytochrome b n=1 Tax=Pelagibius litoralis TaxID=374515 RepID=A0A967F309_9PROT|nr:cytochrome b [Pelagibius litoralis]NIA72083.1 cytochrome b [Pelagibius litoralis]
MQGYRTTARSLHWIVALAVLATIPVGQWMTTEGLERSLQDSLYIFHKNAGVLILLAVVLRLVYRAVYPPPPLPATVPDWQRRASAVSHLTLYALLIVMGVSGYIRVKAGGFPIEMLDALQVPSLVPRSDSLAGTAKAVHSYARLVLVAFIVLHIAAALYHAVWLKDGVFSRMWPLRGR